MAKANRSKAAPAALSKSHQQQLEAAREQADQASLVFAAIIDAANSAEGEAAVHAIRFAALYGHERIEEAVSILKRFDGAEVRHG